MIPSFDQSGNLPAGIYPTDWDDFTIRFGQNAHRRRLLTGLKIAMRLLGSVGCERIYVDGSFVTVKELPNDFDAAWDHSGVDLKLLKSIEPAFFEFRDQRAAQKAKFGGEFFPAGAFADPIGTVFLDFFQIDKETGKPKGIVCLTL